MFALILLALTIVLIMGVGAALEWLLDLQSGYQTGSFSVASTISNHPMSHSTIG